jgi:deoxyribonuclease V
VTTAWPSEAATLLAEQRRLAGLAPPAWQPPVGPPERDLTVAAAFVAFMRGEQGPGHPGDRAWVGAVLLEGAHPLRRRAVLGVAGAPYTAGLLALREGRMLADALAPLVGSTDVVLVDATGRDHPRRAGLALHLGAVLDVPTVGVTHRPLYASGAQPTDLPGDSSPLMLDGEEVARWVRTVPGVRPVVAHAAWRTDASTAMQVVLRCRGSHRTPEPLRQARRVAREARAAAEAEYPVSGRRSP